MSRRRTTLGDVAREVGVSVGTASEALSGRGRMTEATRSAVREAAHRLGYRANALARGLRTGRTHAIGLHLLHAADNFGYEYVREFFAGALAAAHERDYDLNLLSSDPEHRRVAAPQVDGVIIPDPIAADVRANELLASGIPVVVGERLPEGMPAAPVVCVDHESALTQLLDHAYALGARRPVLFVAEEVSGWGVVVREAFSRWCRAHDVPARHCATPFDGQRLSEEGGRLLGTLLHGEDGVDLVIVPAEHLALDALAIIEKAGLTVGREVLLAACNDADVLRRHDPPVTAIDLGGRTVGAACARALISHLDDGVPLAEQTLLPATLVLRASTASLTPRHGGRA